VIDSETLTKMAVIAVITVAALFFFHFKSGSFSATHGPISAMRAAREALQIKVNIMTASFAAIVIVAAARSWTWNQIPRTDAATPAFDPPLGPPIRI
jgi:formate hydrogenlyase subunit 4